MNSIAKLKTEILNTSGIHPCGRAVLLRAVELEERMTGTIVVPEEVRRSSAASDAEGVCVEIGPDAWKDETPRCTVGDRVAFTLYSGGLRKGKDGKRYRLVKADSIYAVIEP